jgi:hypothetical protein
MALMMEYDVAFNPINVAFFSFVRIMFETNDITDLFKQFFRGFFHGMISRKFLDIMPNSEFDVLLDRTSGCFVKVLHKDETYLDCD